MRGILRFVVVIVGIALVGFGPATMLAPDLAASGFGVPAETSAARAYLLAAGTRDFALGIWLLALMWLQVSNRVLAASIFSIAVVAAGDAVNVLASGGRWSAALVHGGSLLILAVLGWRLWVARNE